MMNYPRLIPLCLIPLAFSHLSAADPKHQYTFNDGFGSLVVEDIAGGAHGTLVHNSGAARLEDGQWKTGNDGTQRGQHQTGDYVDLPNGIISALGDQATFELWVTWRGGPLWTHLYDFGISDSLIEDVPTQGTMTSWFMMSPAAKSTIAISRSVLNGSSAVPPEGVIDADAADALPIGVESHVTVVINEPANTNELFVDGVLVASAEVAGKLADLNDVNNWIALSSWGGDFTFNGDLNEVRIYDTALTAAEVVASFNAGPVPPSGNEPIVIPGGRDYLDPTKTKIAQRVHQMPVIDGVIDDADWVPRSDSNWSIREDLDMHLNTPGQVPFDHIRGGNVIGVNLDMFEDDANVNDVRVGFDDNYLYIAASIADFENFSDSAEPGSEDGDVWDDDSVAVFIDGDNSNFPNLSTGGDPGVTGTGGAFVIGRNNAFRDKEAGDPGYGENALWFAKAAESATVAGYNVEFRIALSLLGNPQPGDIIGFNIGVNDDDGGVVRDSIVVLTGTPHAEYSYANLILGGKSYTAPKATAPTVDGAINPGEYPGAEEIVLDRHTGIYNNVVGDDRWPLNDMRATAYVTHDADAVYVGVNVIDDIIVTDTAGEGTENGSTWEDDSVEIFFDADNSDGPGAGNVDGRGDLGFEGQYVLTPNGAWRHAEANNPTWINDWFAATTMTETGYQVEFKVNKSSLSSPADGATMGFHIALNDDDGFGRKCQLNWSGQAHQEISYGDLVLGPGGDGGGEGAGEIDIALNPGGATATVTWTSGGALQSTIELTDPTKWTDVPDASGGTYEADVTQFADRHFRAKAKE